jgi:hypothetical protein
MAQILPTGPPPGGAAPTTTEANACSLYCELHHERLRLHTTDIGMVALGYGKYVRAADIVALIPIEDAERGDGRRTYVYVAGFPAPIVASRSERAILADMEEAPPVASGALRRRDVDGRPSAAEGEVSGGARRWRRPRRRAASAGQAA